MGFFEGLNNQNLKVDKIPQLVIVYTDNRVKKIAQTLLRDSMAQYHFLINDSAIWDMNHFNANMHSFSYKNKVVMIGCNKEVKEFIADPRLKPVYSKYGVDIKIQGNHCSILVTDIDTEICEKLAKTMIKDKGCDAAIIEDLHLNLEKLVFDKVVLKTATATAATSSAVGYKMMKSGDAKAKISGLGVVCIAGAGGFIGGAGAGAIKYQMDKVKAKRDIQYWHSIYVLMEKYMSDLLDCSKVDKNSVASKEDQD